MAPPSLVSYPDSESDGDGNDPADDEPQAKRRKTETSSPPSSNRLPPLPSAFHSLYSTNARVSTADDPSLHGGRKRQVPHVEGHWPTHIYLECRSS
jgi:hypothetical protein